jgi:predicted esterase
VTGAYLAMSVFKPNELPKLDGAKGKPFFIDHSPDDKTCPFKMAEEARDALKKAGAAVEFVTYEGGHGWNGDLWGRLKKGIEHLTKNASK